MNCLVIGYGSIGARHVRLLEELGQRVAVVSRRTLDRPRCYRILAEALAAERPDYVVVATATAEHGEALISLAGLGYGGRVLVEKPLLARTGPLPAHRFAALWVGYNLRFHPLVQAVRGLLAGETVVAAQLAVGQHLAQWRPERDYAATYSASAAAGGGALRDLSHELDLAAWLFGPPRRLTALGGRFGDLAGDADDTWSLLAESERCPALSVHLNCLDRAPRRAITVTTRTHSLHADLIAGRLTVDGTEQPVPCGRDDSYRAMHRAALNDGAGLCALAEGMTVMAMIEAAETAARERRWVALQAKAVPPTA
jgi:predicted dehydrogenase